MKTVCFIVNVICIAIILGVSGRTTADWQYWVIIVSLLILGLSTIARASMDQPEIPMNHKKKRPLSARSHCKMCKYWKINGFGKLRPDFERFSDHKRRMFAKKDIEENV